MNVYELNSGNTVAVELLKAAFKASGVDRPSKVISDGVTGYNKGFVFVEIVDDRKATVAIGRNLVWLGTDHFHSKGGLKRS